MSGTEVDGSEVPENVDQGEENAMPSSQEEEEMIKKKYGGLVPKKPPLIAMVTILSFMITNALHIDHERAFFDSADWALRKQGAPADGKPKEPEELPPKLQPTQNQQARPRRSPYAPTDGEDGGNASEDPNGNE